MRRIEREERRRSRELAREAKANFQRQEQELAAHIVARYEAHLAALTSVHRECGERIDWRRVDARRHGTDAARHRDTA